MKNLKITVNGTAYDVQVEETDANSAPTTVVVPAPTAKPLSADIPKEVEETSGEIIKSPMPGTIVSVNVSNGQKVSKGDILIILEAMKMENEIMSPYDGTITGISVSKGDSVESGAALVTIK